MIISPISTKTGVKNTMQGRVGRSRPYFSRIRTRLLPPQVPVKVASVGILVVLTKKPREHRGVFRW